MTIRVLRPGLLSTVQDLGRPGLQSRGVGPGGAMDPLALRLANVLVGNPPGAAALEFTLTGPVLQFETDALIAMTGAALSPTIAGAPVSSGRAVLVRAGVQLAFGGCTAGCRTYLAVAGGIDVPAVLGSRATNLRARFGGFRGRALRAGDELPVGSPTPEAASLAGHLAPSDRGWAADGTGFARELTAPPDFSLPIRILPGAQFQHLRPESCAALLTATFRVSTRSDRMGYRLDGPMLDLDRSESMTSEAVTWGTVQLPPDGQPIVLLVDRQTTGGYPVIGHVAAADLAQFAQRKPGDSLRFTATTLPMAQRVLIDRERAVASAIRTLQAARAEHATR